MLQELQQSIAEGQIPYPDRFSSIKLKLEFELFADITDEEIEDLKEHINFAKGIKNGYIFF